MAEKSILNPPKKRYDLTDQRTYEDAYPLGDYGNDIEKVMTVPEIDDMPGLAIRSVFKNERQLNASARLVYRHWKFGDIEHQKLMRYKLAGMAAIGGVSRLEQLMTAVKLLASDMYRAARGMPKHNGKNGEERVIRGSDFREQERSPDSLGVR